MKIYCCMKLDEDYRAYDITAYATYAEARNAYKNYLLSIRTKEKWEEYYICEGCEDFEQMIDIWFGTDDYFEVHELEVTGL